MAQSFIADDKHQELMMSFNFDEQYENKAIINAIVDHTPYQLEFILNPDFDFENIKNALLCKHFRIVQRSPEMLKIKIAFGHFLFKNVEKITNNTLRQTIAELNEKMVGLKKQIKQKQQNNAFLQETIKKMRNQFELMAINRADIKRQNEEIKGSMKRMIKAEQERFDQMEKEKNKRIQLQENRHLLIERVKHLQETLKKLQSERLLITNKQRMKESQQERVKREAEGEEKRVKRLKQEIFKKEERQKAQKLQDKKTQNLKVDQYRVIQEVQQRKLIEQEKQLKVKQTSREQNKQNLRCLTCDRKIQLIRNLAFKSQDGLVVCNICYSQQEMFFEKKNNLSNPLNRNEHQKDKYEEKKITSNSADQFSFQKKKQKELQNLQQISTQNAQYHFSQHDKSQKTTIQYNNKVATCKYGWKGLALVEGVVFERGSSIKFKIIQIGGGVAVGLGIKNLILKNKQQIPISNQIDHGFFILFNDGKSLSHSTKEHNDIQTQFKYSKGDVIKVEKHGDKLLWMNEKKWQFSQKIKLTANESNQTLFCVYLNRYSTSSSYIQIVK